MAYWERYEERNESAKERYRLVMDRIGEIGGEHTVPPEYDAFFKETAEFILKIDALFMQLGGAADTGTAPSGGGAESACADTSANGAESACADTSANKPGRANGAEFPSGAEFDRAAGEYFKARSLEQLMQQNQDLYAELSAENYRTSVLNPEYAVERFGARYGGIFSFLRAEIRAMVPYAYEGRIANITILAELFVGIYNLFESGDVDYREVEQTIYWFFHDYCEWFCADAVAESVEPDYDFFTRIIMESDLGDLRYLYRYGAYIGENERKMAAFLNSLPEEKIQAMADTFTEGYRIGFEVANKDLSKKKMTAVHYPVGFERVVRASILNLRKLGLQPTVVRERISSFSSMGTGKNGCYSTSPNRQYDYDHQFDQGYYLDRPFALRRLEVLKDAYEKRKTLAGLQAGPAVIEVFGEPPFSPKETRSRRQLDAQQQETSVFYRNEAGQITDRYIKGEERSFTIIAYPLPEIGPDFAEIFEETVRLNTLDYKTYQNIQARLIEVLDEGEYVRITGKGKNRTDMTVHLHPLRDPQKESRFENCVADVNIPVGEVFTSPVLEGTNGILHVTEVYLDGFRYENLEIHFKNGMIESYGCTNFDTDEKGKKLVLENVLMNHDTLPLGEFAIGTNTTAYRMARDYRIADKLPILIAEKTGPHFAVGDTCYSRAEDVRVYNPDGKEIIAKDNEISRLRNSEPGKAYFNCHTDITIPYDELGAISAVTKDGRRIPVIADGKFVVPGCEELNVPLERGISQ